MYAEGYLMDTGLQRLCSLIELPEGGSRGFLREGLDDRIFVIRRGQEIFAWLNDCPHEHRPMEFKQNEFLSGDGNHIVCYAHSAHFDIRTGECFAGPCKGQFLIKVPVTLYGDDVYVPISISSIFE